MKVIEVSDILGLSQPLTKLVETIARGVGIVYEPTHKKRMAKATAEEIQIIANECQKNLQFPITYDKGQVSVSTNQQFVELAQRAVLRNLNQEMNKQQNIESIVHFAEENLKQETKVSEEPVSQTWLSNFFEAAGHVEEEDLQKIWGKLLAGEIKNPNSYSLRTLNILKNMTTREARIFQKLSAFVVRVGSDCIIPHEDILLGKYNVEYGNILLLDECGLVNAQGTLNLTYSSKPGSMLCLYNHKFQARLFESAGINMHLYLNIYPLTAVGKELFGILKQEPVGEFFKDYIALIEKNNKNISSRIVENSNNGK